MSYQQLHQHFLKISHFSHLDAICSWDQAAVMPDGGNDARGAAMAELSVLIHQLTTAPQLADWISVAETESLEAQERASLTAIKRRPLRPRRTLETIHTANTASASRRNTRR